MVKGVPENPNWQDKDGLLARNHPTTMESRNIS
jgi:hypothetical protein